MSVQVKHRRDTAANIAGFTPAQGEIIVDTDNKRMIVGDGATAGGIAAAKLSEVQVATRRAIADVAATATAADRLIAYTSLTAARVVTLPAASAFPTGATLTVVDESGACSATNTLTLARAGSDTINGLTAVVIAAAYGSAQIESNGSNAWTVLAPDPVAATQLLALVAHGGGFQAQAIEQTTTLSGATTNAATHIPNPFLCLGVSMRVITAITGATSFSLGDAGSASRFGAGLGIALGSTNYGLIGPNPYYGSSDTLIFTAAGGTFSGGVVRTTIYGFAPLAIAN